MNTSVNPVGPAPASFGEVAQRRRSVYAYLDEPVPRPIIERALAQAVLAPNHHRTAPWRFFVIAREARHRLVSAYETAALRTERDVARAAQRAKDAPVNVVVACVPTLDNPRVVAKEEEFATAAAVQNFLLSLADAGVGSLLTTGPLAESPEVAALVGLEALGGHVVGVINVGYPNPERPIPRRPEAQLDRVVRWIDAH